jgi:hypothetical protein
MEMPLLSVFIFTFLSSVLVTQKQVTNIGRRDSGACADLSSRVCFEAVHLLTLGKRYKGFSE